MQFIVLILVKTKSYPIEYWMLHSLRKVQSISKFKSDFMLDEENYSVLQQRWDSILDIDGDKVIINAKDIQEHMKSLKPKPQSDYAKKLIHSGKIPEI